MRINTAPRQPACGTGGTAESSGWFSRTVGVVAVGVPPLASVEANPVVNDTGFSKAAVGSSFDDGVADPALRHPASSAHVETCHGEKTSRGCVKSVLGKKLCSLFKQVEPSSS